MKIGNEIMFGTLSSSTIGSLTRGDDGTTASHTQMEQLLNYIRYSKHR